jgi:hypothetical protein
MRRCPLSLGERLGIDALWPDIRVGRRGSGSLLTTLSVCFAQGDELGFVQLIQLARALGLALSSHIFTELSEAERTTKPLASNRPLTRVCSSRTPSARNASDSGASAGTGFGRQTAQPTGRWHTAKGLPQEVDQERGTVPAGRPVGCMAGSRLRCCEATDHARSAQGDRATPPLRSMQLTTPRARLP